MKVSDDLTALVFELQRARSPVEKGRALARAWRTIRGLSATERRLLVREVGFDGAEDLVEGLAGKSGGTFAPAAVLEALGRMRKDESLTVRGILADLRDPGRREDLLVRGIDLVVGDEPGGGDEELEEFLDSETVGGDGSAENSAAVSATEIPLPGDKGRDEAEPAGAEARSVPADVVPPPPPPAETKTHDSPSDPGPAVEVDREPDPAPVVENREEPIWDEIWRRSPTSAVAPVLVGREKVPLYSGDATREREVAGSVLHRLRGFRDGIADLRGGGSTAVLDALDALPEPWAKRRAVVALIESGIPEDVSAALDLVEELDRPMDRRWCLAALARRGDLDGDDLERALGMLASPAARRRVRRLAGGES